MLLSAGTRANDTVPIRWTHSEPKRLNRVFFDKVRPQAVISQAQAELVSLSCSDPGETYRASMDRHGSSPVMVIALVPAGKCCKRDWRLSARRATPACMNSV